jgi:hypothetical protein
MERLRGRDAGRCILRSVVLAPLADIDHDLNHLNRSSPTEENVCLHFGGKQKQTHQLLHPALYDRLRHGMHDHPHRKDRSQDS